MSISEPLPDLSAISPFQIEPLSAPVAEAACEGLSASRKWLPAWLFYDEEGSRLFERITLLPEYYPTRTERAIFSGYAGGIVDAAVKIAADADASHRGQPLRVLELGAGTASKTGILLDALLRRQGRAEYVPVDVSSSALEEAKASLQRAMPSVTVQPQVANYVTDELVLPPHNGPTVALYIGSSIGNFNPDEAADILCNLRRQLRPGDSLLLGTDLVKEERTLLAAYDDAQGVTAAFNSNMLLRLNRELGANFDPACFRHCAVWNAAKSRIEMHLESVSAQTVRIAALDAAFAFKRGETIHTENSYKFTPTSIDTMLAGGGFRAVQQWTDERQWFAVTLAAAA